MRTEAHNFSSFVTEYDYSCVSAVSLVIFNIWVVRYVVFCCVICCPEISSVVPLESFYLHVDPIAYDCFLCRIILFLLLFLNGRHLVLFAFAFQCSLFVVIIYLYRRLFRSHKLKYYLPLFCKFSSCFPLSCICFSCHIFTCVVATLITFLVYLPC